MKILSSILAVVVLAHASMEKPPTTTCHPDEPCSLVGKPIVTVVVESMAGPEKTLGLSKTQLTADAELELRRHGIKVGKYEMSGVVLYINVHVETTAFKGVPYSIFGIHVSGRQAVKLFRQEDVSIVSATTWSTPDGLGMAPSDLAKAEIVKFTGDLTRQFANAYLAANQ